MDGNISVSLKEYIRLQTRDSELSRLEGAGVDNWQGYGEGFEGWDEEKEQIKKDAEKLFVEQRNK